MTEELTKPYKKLISFNIIASVIGAIVLLLLNMILFIGSKEDFYALQNEMPKSFINRFFAFSLLGLIGVIILTLVNVISNLTWLKNNEKVNIIKVGLIDLGIVVLSCLIGTTMFFLS